jgi:hypothetical protein
MTLRIIGILDFVYRPGLKKLEHAISETGSVSFLRRREKYAYIFESLRES